ncbi:hypothetical protein [Ideonella sp. BN130291]|uniref:hypothetical protein n=1 Tax=Ideonella sp. BN130291 TaxID=3112940 RepID=UPI002E271965|nr:hypothetical protein [Ideonella sp. BN130291]
MRTRLFHAVLVLLGCTAGPVWADGGLTVDADKVPWPRLQTRVGLVTTNPLAADVASANPYALQGGQILGDYYFSRGPLFGSQRVSGGFRATSGWLLNSHGVSLSMPAVPRPGGAFTVSQQNTAGNGPADLAGEGGHAAPYLGVGYTGLSLKGGWGFTADVGVLALGSGSGLRPGKLGLGNTSLDEQWRDFRLTPVLQLGVSYSF